MKAKRPILTTLLAVSAAAPALALEHGSLDIVELNSTNNSQATTSPAVAVTIKPGSSPNFAVRGYNRGDTDVSFSATPETDVQNGTMITSVTENGRNNHPTNPDAPDGISYATSHAAGTAGYYIPVFAASGGVEASGGEYNVDLAAAWFPYAEGWLAGYGWVTDNGGVITNLSSPAGIRLGTEFIDHKSVDGTNGIFTVDLRALESHGVPATAANGIVLAIGAKNEDNFAMAQDNADGTFTLSVMDNGSTNATGYEQDSVAFAYIPAAAAGRGNVKALGRIQSDGGTELGAGDFTITKQGVGEWLLRIAGETDDSGTLIISADGGKPPAGTTRNNTDNIVSYQWDGTLGGWVIQSRDLPNVVLEDGASADEDMFSFAFFTDEPALALTSPAYGSLRRTGDVTLSAAATGDTPGGIQQVEFFVNGVSAGVDTAAPYEIVHPLAEPGHYRIEAFATLSGGAVVSTPQTPVLVEAVVNAPVLPGYTAATINGGDLQTTPETPPAATADWQVLTSTPSPFVFTDLGTVSGEPAIRINGSPVPFDSGILLAANYGGDDYADVTTHGPYDNNVIPRNNGGNYALSVEDNEAGATTKESSQLSLGFFPYADGWVGANAAADATILDGSSNLPAGIQLAHTGTGEYTAFGLPLAGNLIAIGNGADTGADNVVAIGKHDDRWRIRNTDNDGNVEDGAFSFLYIPEDSTQVLSGLIANDGTVVPLNIGLEAMGATVTVVGGAYEIRFGDGTKINPATAALFVSADFNNGNGGDNVYSYHADGDKFVVQSHDLPNLNTNPQAGGFRFLVTPFAPAVLNGDEVEIAVTDGVATEGTADNTLEFQLTRFGDIDADLTVSYQLGGTAANGVDYQSLPGTVTFPAGQRKVAVTVTLINDTVFELDETFSITLTPGSGYSVGLSDNAGGVIHNAASLVPTVRVSFQDGVGGYDGTFVKFISRSIPRTVVQATDGEGNPIFDENEQPVMIDEYGTPVDGETLGSAVPQSYLDGFPGHKGETPADDSPDINAMIRFDGIFGDGPGQVPVGATIAKAELVLTTGTTANSVSGGPFVVDQLVVPVDETTTYADLDWGLGFEGVRGGCTGVPLAAFGAMTTTLTPETGDVTAIVRSWADALAADPENDTSHGFGVFTGGTSDGWQFCSEGNADPALRPKLVISYVLAETRSYTFGADLSARVVGQAATEDGSLLATGFIDAIAGGTQEALMRFPVEFGGAGIPLDEEIVKAELVLLTGSPLFGGSANAQSNGPVAAHRMLVPWDVTTQFGYNGPEVGTHISSSVSRVKGIGQGSTAYLDITSIVQAWRAGEANHGVNIKPETTDGWQFFWPGSTYAGTTPVLRIVTARTTTGEPTAFDLWAEAQGAAGAGQQSDDDGDGVPALVEYALGLDLGGHDQLPGVTISGGMVSLQFAKGASAKSDTALGYRIVSSSDLINWVPVQAAVDGADDITMSVPVGTGPLFYRLLVTYNP